MVKLKLYILFHGETYSITFIRDGGQWRETTSSHEGMNIDTDDMNDKSDESDIMLNRSIGSSSSNHLVGSPYPDELGNKVGLSPVQLTVLFSLTKDFEFATNLYRLLFSKAFAGLLTMIIR